MLKVRFENYIDDFTKYYEDKNFYSLDELRSYLKKEVEKRCVSKASTWWRNPCGVRTYNDGEKRGWFRAGGRDRNTYDLWLTQVETSDGVVVFVENKYCSPKMYEFLKSMHDEFETKPVYGDL